MMICDHFDPQQPLVSNFLKRSELVANLQYSIQRNHHVKLHFSRLSRSLDTVIRQPGSCTYQANINKITDKMPVDTFKCLQFDNPVTLKEFTST